MPYNLKVKTIDWKENDHSIKLYQNIFVSKFNHRRIIVGKRGETLKKIGVFSRKELEFIFNKNVHLFLFVKVKKNWIKNSENFFDFGLN